MANRIYTGRDIQALRNSLVSAVEALDNNTWTDFNESDLSTAFIEIAAGLGDMLGFYLDKQALECYIDSVKQRRNGIAILNLINYVPYMTTSCRTNVVFSVTTAQTADIIIPKYTVISGSTDDATINYVTAEECVIKTGSLSATVSAIQGDINKAYSTVGNIRSNQKIYIDATNVAKGSVVVQIGSTIWTPTENVLYDDTVSTNYSVYEDKECKPYVLFNNSWQSLLPAEDSTQIIFTYLTSLGANGKVAKGILTSADWSGVTRSDGATVSTDNLSVTNPELSSGGCERETLDHARALAPSTFKMLGKAITLPDFKTMTMDQPGVLNCQAVDWSVEDGAYVSAPYIVDIYIVPVGGGDCSSSFLSDIMSYFNSTDNRRILSSVKATAYTAKYVTIDIKAKVYSSVAESAQSDLKATIISAIKSYFDPANLSFGKGVALSNLITLIQESSAKIDSLDLESPSTNISLSKIQFPQLGSIDITIEKSSTSST